MSKTTTNLLFMAAGAALGAAVTYVATSDKKEEWVREINKIVAKIKGAVGNAACECEEELEDLVEDEG
ncbi:hypothetical protein M2132_000571 [Dysgonomonas sp. PH5-45]|uniref:YtxH domain-containing protein n=1 Tax=unclassified Dysgonomonas TaxID=2630389 RepID=UPI002473658E|nr:MULTISPECIES: YtxH domain-containing protein [unclassified Dysgonomonas]MDH6354244.1 hypothetical protein [Dysgonomonas sp. PH5-45]MDH6387145.1 hypothetical protein [Dysgonomonas sp. PH5-37]